MPMSSFAEPAVDPTLSAAALRDVLGGLLPELLERRGDALAVKELPSGRWVHANAAMADLLAYLNSIK